MLRIVYFVAAVALTSAASAVATCDASVCSSCVGTGLVAVCVNYTAPPPPPICPLGCGGTACTATCTTNCAATCNVCVRATSILGACVSVTFGVAPILTSQTSLDAGFDLSLLNSPSIVTVDAQASGTVDSNAIVTLTGATAIANLHVGGGLTGAAIFQLNSSITVNSWNNNAGSAKVDNKCGALVVGNLSVGGSTFSVFQSCPAAVVTLSNIDFSPHGSFSGSSTLHISGGVAHVNGAASGSITGSGYLQLSGGVSVDGNIPLGVTLQVAAAGMSAPVAVVEANSKLNISGNAEGSGSLVVNGQFIVGSASVKVDPRVVINSAATFTINAATAFRAKAVDVAVGATLVIGANANKGTVYVERMAKCAGTVRIELGVTASAFTSGSGAGAATGFTYSSNNVPKDLSNCVVELLDSTGKTFTLTSTTTASVGRRLLAGSGTANWGSDSMTYTMQSAASSFFALVPVVAVGMIGLLL